MSRSGIVSLDDLLASHSPEHLSFFFLFFPSFFSPFFSPFFSLSGLFRCVLVPGTLALHLLYLDELQLYGLLCFGVTTGFASL